MTTTEIFGFGTGIIGLASAVAMGVSSYRDKTTKIKDASAAAKNDIIMTYEKRMKLMEEDLQDVKSELVVIKVLFEKSEADRIRAENMLNLRNPEFDKYMTLTLKLLTDIHGAVMSQTVAHPA